MSARTSSNRSAACRRITRSHTPLESNAKTRSNIPDDTMVICSIVVSYVAAPDPQLTLSDLTKTAFQLLKDKGYKHRAIEIAFTRLVNGYFTPE